MEKAVGIICEFNPFHFGHAYLLEQAHSAFPDRGIVCVMSGNFVQRGSFAIQEKYSRALCALRGGADLVLEMPFPFSSLSAESFASAGVRILKGLGVCDTLAFGTELDDAHALSVCAENLASEEFEAALKAYFSRHPGAGYPAAREAVYTSLFGHCDALSRPNASLAVNYLLASRKENASFSFYPILRKGEGFHSEKKEGTFLSATALRSCVWEGESLFGKLPEFTRLEIEKEKAEGRFPVTVESLSAVLFYLLKTKSRKELSSVYGFSALCDRAVRYCGECQSVEELVEKIKNPSFTDSRIRRGLLALLLQIPRFAEKEVPAYTTLLACNARGRDLLGAIKEQGTIPVFTKPAHAFRSEDKTVQHQASRAYLADEIYAMAFPQKQRDGFFIKKMPYVET
ncbi:MAG: nucleotidyltransferase family protein [Ruminococcaceae bacterium]|nr:nucleotidyltransferase family protein [Oscillospiraceae bacterium]